MIKGSAILIAALCVTWLLRKRSAAERHVVLAAAILSAALLPVLSLVIPSWHAAWAARMADALPTISARSLCNLCRSMNTMCLPS